MRASAEQHTYAVYAKSAEQHRSKNFPFSVAYVRTVARPGHSCTASISDGEHVSQVKYSVDASVDCRRVPRARQTAKGTASERR